MSKEIVMSHARARGLTDTKRDIHIYVYVKRDIYVCQKRRIYIQNRQSCGCTGEGLDRYQKRHTYVYIYVKRDIYICQKRRKYTPKKQSCHVHGRGFWGMLEKTYVYICQKRHMYMSKETHVHVKRDICTHKKDTFVPRTGEELERCQKRHIYTYICQKRCISCEELERCQNRHIYTYMCRKRRMYISKETF